MTAVTSSVRIDRTKLAHSFFLFLNSWLFVVGKKQKVCSRQVKTPYIHSLSSLSVSMTLSFTANKHTQVYFNKSQTFHIGQVFSRGPFYFPSQRGWSYIFTNFSYWFRLENWKEFIEVDIKDLDINLRNPHLENKLKAPSHVIRVRCQK